MEGCKIQEGVNRRWISVLAIIIIIIILIQRQKERVLLSAIVTLRKSIEK